jgi:uncharacterized protein YukE
MQADRASSQLSERHQQCDQLQQKLTATKELCKELENQLNDYEALVEHTEEQDKLWQSTKSVANKPELSLFLLALLHLQAGF